jgi:hypothetical protein
MGVSVIVFAHLQQPLRLALLLKVRKFKAEKPQVPARVRACPSYFKARKNHLLLCAPIEPCAGIQHPLSHVSLSCKTSTVQLLAAS